MTNLLIRCSTLGRNTDFKAGDIVSICVFMPPDYTGNQELKYARYGRIESVIQIIEESKAEITEYTIKTSYDSFKSVEGLGAIQNSKNNTTKIQIEIASNSGPNFFIDHYVKEYFNAIN